MLGLFVICATVYILIKNTQGSDIIEPKVIYGDVFMLLIGLAMGAFATYVVIFAK